MQISSINSYHINSNQTFRAKNINKVASKVNGKQVLDKFEKGSNKIPKEFLAVRNGCLITGGVFGLAAGLQMLNLSPLILLPAVGIIAGLCYTLTSMSLNAHSKNKTSSKDDNIKQNSNDKNETQKPEVKEIKKVEKIKHKFPIIIKKPVEDKFAGMTKEDIIATHDSSFIKEAMIVGKIDLTTTSLNSLSHLLNKADYEEVINFLADSLQQNIDENRQTPLHRYNAKQNYTIVRNLWNYPEVIAEILTAKDINGEMSIHKYINDDYSEENFENIKRFFHALHSQNQLNYQTILTVFEAKNAKGISAIDWLKKHCKIEKEKGNWLPFSETMLNLLYYAKKDYKENSQQEYQPFVPISDLQRKNYITNLINNTNAINFDNIMQILNNDEIQKTHGLDLNLHENYITEIIEYLINNANTEESKKIITKLKELNRLDYDKIDKNNISTIELIMNAEDDELLELVKNNHFKYRPELDYAYNNIQNPNFKEKIKSIQFDFVELKNAVDKVSVEELEKYICHSDSPLYNKDIHGIEMKISLIDKIVPKKFFEKYNEYYSRFIPYERY